MRGQKALAPTFFLGSGCVHSSRCPWRQAPCQPPDAAQANPGHKKEIHVVVATPGRLLDLMNRRTVNLQEIKHVILDEADEMLNMGFSESINEIGRAHV